MTLQFHPYQPTTPSASDYVQQWGQGLNAIGNTIQHNQEQALAQRRQAMLDQYLKQEQGRKTAEFNYEYRDPLARPNPDTSGDVPQQPSMFGGGQPPSQGSSLIEQWNQKMGVPGQAQVPSFRGVSGNSDPYAGMSPEMKQYASMPGAKNRAGYATAYKDFGNPEERAAEIALKQAQAAKATSEANNPNRDESYTVVGTDAAGNIIQVGTKTGRVRTIQPTPGGGPIYPRNVTDAQASAAGYGDRAAVAHQEIEKVLREGLDPAAMSFGAAESRFTPNIVKNKTIQGFDQAKRNFVNAILRRESGAVISPSEFEEANKQYFPVYGDKPETIRQKSANRAMQIQNLKRSAGPMAIQPGTQANGGASSSVDPLGIR